MHSLKATEIVFVRQNYSSDVTSIIGGRGEFMNNLKLKLLSMSSVLCSFAVMLATVLAPGCRSNWYQPKEPKNLTKLLKK